MPDDESQQVRGSTGGEALGSMPLAVFMDKAEQVVTSRMVGDRTLADQRWKDHLRKHRDENTLVLRGLEDRIRAKEELDAERWAAHNQVHTAENHLDKELRVLHGEVHTSLAAQLRTDDAERKLRDDGQNEWRGTLNDVIARMPSRETTDNLATQIRDIQLALATNAGRDRTVAALMSVPGVLVSIMVLILFLTEK